MRKGSGNAAKPNENAGSTAARSSSNYDPSKTSLPQGHSFAGARDFDNTPEVNETYSNPSNSPFKRVSAKDDVESPNVVNVNPSNNVPGVHAPYIQPKKELQISDAQKFDKLNSEIQQKFSAFGGGLDFTTDDSDDENSEEDKN